jgi:hypothetical protein
MEDKIRRAYGSDDANPTAIAIHQMELVRRERKIAKARNRFEQESKTARERFEEAMGAADSEFKEKLEEIYEESLEQATEAHEEDPNYWQDPDDSPRPHFD